MGNWTKRDFERADRTRKIKWKKGDEVVLFRNLIFTYPKGTRGVVVKVARGKPGVESSSGVSLDVRFGRASELSGQVNHTLDAWWVNKVVKAPRKRLNPRKKA